MPYDGLGHGEFHRSLRSRLRRGWRVTLIGVYVGIGIFTFGRAAADCRICSAGFDNAMVGVIAAGAWPLWWSWQFQVSYSRH
jgi:hypothetical protein